MPECCFPEPIGEPKPFVPLPWRCFCKHLNEPGAYKCHNCGWEPEE